MKIATAGSAKSKRWRTEETTWQEVLKRLRTLQRTGETAAEYRAMSKEEKAERKGAAGGFVGGALSGPRRTGEAVTERWLITLDADNAGEEDWEDAELLAPWAMCCYTTHSHTSKAPRLRWIVPLRAAVSPEAYEPLARKAAEKLGIIDTLDASTYQAARLMYFPTASRDGEFQFHEQDGELLDPAELLAEYGPGQAWKDVSLWPTGAQEREIVRREVKRQADPTEKRGIVGEFCRAYDVPAAIDEFLPDVYDPAAEGRYTYTGGSTANGAVLYGDGLWLYSNHATDPAGGQLCNAFDLVRIHKFGELDYNTDGSRKKAAESEDSTRWPSYQAMCAWAGELPEIKRAVAQRQMESARMDFSDLEGAGAGDPADSCAEERNDDWTEKLTRNHKTMAMDPSIENARLILENDPNLAGAVALNEFSGLPVLRRDVPWSRAGRVRDGLNGEPWTDTDDAGLRLYMEQVWKLQGRQVIQDAWALVKDANKFHPVREYLDGLEWDGVERLDEMLIRWMGAEDTPFTRAATRKWMCAAVARVYQPGRKFDNMLVLVGPQGVGKSRLARTLSRGWFTDSLTSMNGKEAYEGVRGVWIVEVAELAAAKRSETETIKNFISKESDTYRPAYGRNVVEYKRQCVFYGTTNDPDFLKDKSGNRRFWPINVDGLDRGRLTGLEQEVDQLWAEAKTRLEAGEPLWMDTDELMDLATEAQGAFTVGDELAGMVQEYLEKPLPEDWEEWDPDKRTDFIQGNLPGDPGPCTKRRDRISLLEIRTELLGDSRRDLKGNDNTGRRLGDILNNLPGWRRVRGLRKLHGYGPQRVYVRIGGVADSEENDREWRKNLTEERVKWACQKYKERLEGDDLD